LTNTKQKQNTDRTEKLLATHIRQNAFSRCYKFYFSNHIQWTHAVWWIHHAALQRKWRWEYM